MNPMRLAHEITRNSIQRGDNYAATFAAALKLAHKVIRMAREALATFEEIDTAPTIHHVPSIAGRAGRLCNNASRLLWGAWNPAGYRMPCLAPALCEALEESYYAVIDGSHKEAWEMLVCTIDPLCEAA